MGCQYLTKHQNYECTNHCMHVSLTSALQPQQTGGLIGFSSVENLSAWTNLPYSSVTVLKAKTQLWGQPKQYMLGALSIYPLHVHDNHLNNILRLDHLGWSIHCYKWECLECLAWGMQEGKIGHHLQIDCQNYKTDTKQCKVCMCTASRYSRWDRGSGDEGAKHVELP